MLTPRTTLGHYEVTGALGAGGMGEVYAAVDVNLRRRVALKLLPPEMAADSERLHRFKREAQTVAALNHPNIVTIYSVEECEGVHFLTMELVEGTTLEQIISAGGIPWTDFFRWSIPLADAISAAHEQGVVHRDLKPANIMVSRDGRLKILDFGIAKLKTDVRGTLDTMLPVTDRVTAPLQLVGTAAYMSPEQAEGKPVDARSDIFSMGIVLYQTATGKRPFTGDTPLALLSAIIREPAPSLVADRADAPPEIDRIVRRCLAKDITRRYQTALDLRNDLEEARDHLASSTVPATNPPSRSRPWWTSRAALVGGAAALAMVAIAYVSWRALLTTPADPMPRVSFTQLTHRSGIEWFPSLSPDGRWVVYAADAEGNRDIYLHSTSGQTPINLTKDSLGDDDQPAFSPDGERIAFRSTRDGGGLFVMGRTGEAVRRLTRTGFNPAWSRDGRIIAFTTIRLELRPQNSEGISELWVVDVDGGEPRRVRDADSALPSWSPSGARIAFGVRLSVNEQRGDILSIPAAGGAAVPITQDLHLDWNPVWAPDGQHVYFVSDRGGSTNIWRVPIDEATGRTLGEAQPITSPAPFAAHLTVTADGRRLAYSSVLETQNIQKLSFDPVAGAIVGEPVPVTTGSRFWANPDPSPSGDAVVAYSQVNPEGDLYIIRTDGSGSLRQLTTDGAIDRVPRWSPDGAWIAAFSDRGSSLQVWKVRTDGSELQQVTFSEEASVATWSPDGSRLAATNGGQAPNPPAEASGFIVDVTRPWTEQQVETIPLAPPPDSRFVPNSWSPDGTWIAGQQWFATLGITLFAPRTRAFRRLTEFGEWPVWLPDSRRILFVSRLREFHVLDTESRQTTLVYLSLRDTLGPPRLTRDGRQVFFSRRVTESDIWLVNLQ